LQEGENRDIKIHFMTRVVLLGIQELPPQNAGKEEAIHSQGRHLQKRRGKHGGRDVGMDGEEWKQEGEEGMGGEEWKQDGEEGMGGWGMIARRGGRNGWVMNENKMGREGWVGKEWKQDGEGGRLRDNRRRDWNGVDGTETKVA
jgi:hypothetical protein